MIRSCIDVYIEEIAIVRTKLIKEYSLNLSEEQVYGVEEAHKIFNRLIGGATVEKLALICMDTNHYLVNASIINIGTSNNVEIVPSEIFRVAILSNADSIIICHNHPAGCMKPSQYDFDMTKKIGYLGNIMGIKLVDSLILGDNGECLSIREELHKSGVENESK